MKRLISAIGNDIVLQYRFRFYHVYLIVIVVFAAVLRFMPGQLRDLLLPVLAFSDPSILVFFIVAAQVLFEKDAKSLQAISVTPLRPSEYLLAKAISLATLAVLASLLLAVLTKGSDFNPLLLIAGSSLGAMTFVFIGFILVARHHSFTRFMPESMLAIMLFTIPALGYLQLWNSWVFGLLPAWPVLQLVAAAFTDAPDYLMSMVSVAALLLWNSLLLKLAKRQYLKYIKGQV